MPYYMMSVFILLCALSGMAFGEEDKNKQNTPPPTTETPPDKKPAQKKPLQEFTPSEEISADKPVAFPVDI